MNSITRFVRSMRRNVIRHDSDFEEYYGAVAMQSNGGPNAMEARRDYEQARRFSNRIGMY